MEQYCLVFKPIDIVTKNDRGEYTQEEIVQITAILAIMPDRVADPRVTPGNGALTVDMRFKNVNQCIQRVNELEDCFQNSKIKRLDVTTENERRKNGFYNGCKIFGYTFISAFISSFIALYLNEYPNVPINEIPSVLLLSFIAAAAVALAAMAVILLKKAEKTSEEII